MWIQYTIVVLIVLICAIVAIKKIKASSQGQCAGCERSCSKQSASPCSSEPKDSNH